MMRGPILCLIVLLTALDQLDAFSAIANNKASFLQTVTGWLDKEDIAWQLLQDDAKSTLFPRDITTNQPILEVKASSNAFYYLHILKSPNSTSDCLSPICTRDMTNYVQYMNACTKRENDLLDDNNGGDNNASKISLIHLHEDVWHSKIDIVQSRLRVRLGGTSSLSRVYARKTVARRIDAGTAIPFLKEHHLWSATKARYYYGLFLPSKDDANKEDVLVAVATFSTKRKISRGNQQTRSHELIRFCTRANGVVIGGITKLMRAFIKEQEPVDDIITVIDRDWGPGDGWHPIGFETLHVSAPVVMVVKDGIRRYLAGAGIKNDKIRPGSKIDNTSTGRPGVDGHVMEELAGLTTHQEALQCLVSDGYYPVYDAGVERLVMVVPNVPSKETQSKEALPFALHSTYAATYRSKNSGIASLLGNAMAMTASSLYGRQLSETLTEAAKINDSTAAQSDMADWRASGGNAKSETFLYRGPSSLDPLATVEVRKRPGGWCTLGIVGGATKSIRHGSFKMVETEDDQHCLIDSSAMVSEYLRTMAAVAVTGLEFCQSHPDEDGDEKPELSFLYLGYGAGSLPRFMAEAVPESRHVAVELDDGVVRATHDCGLLRHSMSSDTSRIELQLGDALAYRRPANSDPFDVVFVDIFDGDNLLPTEFYSKDYLDNVYKNYLGGRPDGIIVHNFHTGGKKLRSQLEDAIRGYRNVFSTTLTVESVDSRHTGGNTVLLATNKRRLDASSETLSWHRAGMKAQNHPGLSLDVIARTNHKLWLS